MTTDQLPSLSIDGPHSPENTRAVAALMSQCAHFLNHATGNHAGTALEYPSDVDSIVGSLSAVTAMLPQMNTQMARWLREQDAGGRIEIDRSSSLGPTEAALMAEGALSEAGIAADAAHDWYSSAQRYTSTMAAAGD